MATCNNALVPAQAYVATLSDKAGMEMEEETDYQEVQQDLFSSKSENKEEEETLTRPSIRPTLVSGTMFPGTSIMPPHPLIPPPHTATDPEPPSPFSQIQPGV